MATLCAIMLGAVPIGAIYLRGIGTSAEKDTPRGAAVQVVSSRTAPARATPSPAIGGIEARAATDIPGDPMADRRAAELARISDAASPFLGYNPKLKSLHDRLRAEGRDEAWATRSEAMLAREYAAMAGIRGTDQMPHIHCGTTLCEVSGSLAFPESGIAMDSVQAPAFSERMWGQGYRPMDQSFGPGKNGEQMFIGYFRREAPITMEGR